MTYKSLRVEEIDGKFTQNIKELSLKELDIEDVLVHVKYSALNYKDALSASGNRGVTRDFPHTPGIDASGIVKRSSSNKFRVGDKVIVTSFDLGMNTNGAFSQYISVPESWIIPLPKTLTLKEAICIGTAGLTSAIATFKLIANGQKTGNNMLVTGSTGAVGSFSVKLLSHLGFRVTALTSKIDKKEFLTSIGADEVILKDNFETHAKRPLLKPKYDGAIDVIGGKLLENILKQINSEGSVATCGLVESPQINTSVFPFILRGVNLLGVDSAKINLKFRNTLWNMLSNEWRVETSQMIHEHNLEDLPSLIDEMLAGKNIGKAIIKID
ncbi:MAG: YhdH/YhfP family quinone oxidoreductase [Sulfurospirillum sp.]|nr:YhdH/YhfP family quinone oxidoreductase [Sulfurospirillum sp.]